MCYGTTPKRSRGLAVVSRLGDENQIQELRRWKRARPHPFDLRSAFRHAMLVALSLVFETGKPPLEHGVFEQTLFLRYLLDALVDVFKDLPPVQWLV